MKPARARKLAAEAGRDLWWDPSQRLWTLTKEGERSEYIAAAALWTMPETLFVSHYLESDR